MLVGYGYKYFIEGQKKREIKNLIAKYVSKDIMDTILHDVEGSKLGGKRADISILFADIRNFTSISDNLEPEEVSSILNEYFSEMIPIVFNNKGTVNKFMGDALLVIFGAPVENPEHPKMAVKCAVDMIKKVNGLQKKWQDENKPLIDIGIGISSGIAFVGNIGSDERHEYSAIGNIVNTANRLESFNKIYKTNILICENTYKRVESIIEAEEIDSICITQSSEPIKIYEIKSLKS
jgi:adenylate cyclase